ncbi:MAG: UDP-N-acetylglucosamine:LPS N-acetylglucosamine transferase, partial [Mycobacterium sp.]|nr:UDP-N-acetylglucosamine:LPS N-acetylglucosamine transferase [Mycobacterium sp.]
MDHPFAATVTLARDDTADTVAEPTAHGALHWVPHHDTGLQERMQTIAQWVADARPAAVVVDVSVEVATFVRLLGVPVIVVAQPG